MIYTLPFDDKTTVDILNGKCDDVYMIEAKQSLKNLGDKLLIYISNTSINAEFSDIDKLTFEEKEKLINNYLAIKSICHIKQLEETVLKTLLFYVGVPDDENEIKSILTYEETINFVENNESVICRLLISIFSSVVCMIKNVTDRNIISDSEFIKSLDVIEDRDFTPINFVHLFNYDETLLCFDACNWSNLKYLKYQLEKPMFGNKYLGEYVLQNKNLLAGFFVTLLPKQ